MKVTVSTRDQTAVVNLNNHTKLTPTSARAARDIAFGVGAHATVKAGYTCYRVTKSGARKIR